MNHFIKLAVAFIVMMNSCTNKTMVDLIVKNATIYTVDSAFSTARAAAISNGRFVAVGTTTQICNRYKAAKTVNLEGKYMYPGFMDPHSHFYGYSQTLSQVDLIGTTSYQEVIDRAKTHHQKYQTAWVTGRGWDQNDWENQDFPDNTLLDIAFPDTPVLLRRVDGHAAIANSVALKIAGITAITKIDGGKIILKNGKLTGLLIDKAVDKVLEAIPLPTKTEAINGLLLAQKKCFAVGLTSVSDAGLDKATILLIDSLQQSGALKMRIYAMLNPTNENIEHFMKNGHYKTGRLHVRALKLYADGALGSRGACLIEPYSDDTANYGFLLEIPEYLKKMCRLAYKADYQVNTHCIGDSANRLMLHIYGEILKGENDRRWRIEHAQVVNKNDVPLYGKFSVIPSMQTTHCTSDMYWAGKRLGNRITDAYIWQDLLKQNGWFPNGSDFPIESINPLYGFYAGVTRKDQYGWPDNGFYPEQKLTRQQALRSMTIWAAKAQFEENEKGSIEPGKFADFVVLPTDLMHAPESELFKIKVAQTYIGGERVY